MNEKTGLEHYEKLYGDLNLPPDDAAKWIFLSGWNSAMGEAMRRVNSMPFQNDTRASFAVYFQQMMVLDPEAVKEKPAPVPVEWMEMVTANLVREGVNKHKARELAEHFYGIKEKST